MDQLVTEDEQRKTGEQIVGGGMKDNVRDKESDRDKDKECVSICVGERTTDVDVCSPLPGSLCPLMGSVCQA